MLRGRKQKRVDPKSTTVTLENELMLRLKAYCKAESEALGKQVSISDAVAEAVERMLDDYSCPTNQEQAEPT